MAHDDLFDQAAMDALGLLDRYESALFTRSFHRAPLDIQKQVIELQAAIATDESLLPDELPDPSLRERVLAAVAKAAESAEVGAGPLARIDERSGAEYEVPPIEQRKARATAMFWRAAVLVLSVALVIVSYFGVQAMRFNNQLARAAFADMVHEEFEAELGPSYREFIGHPACQTVRFNSPDGEFEGSVTMYINHSTREAYVVAMSMPSSGEPYELLSNVNGQTTKVRSFDVRDRPIIGVRLTDLSPAMTTTATWTITNARGTVVMRSS